MASDLPEVYYPPNRDPPEVSPNQGAPELFTPNDPEPFPKAPDNEGLQIAGQGELGAVTGAPVEKPAKGRGAICGLRTTVFWLVVAVGVAIVVIAVLGGVLGSVLTRRGGDSSAQAPSDGANTLASGSAPTPAGSGSSSSGSTSGSTTGSSSVASSVPTTPADSMDTGAVQCPANNMSQYRTSDGKIWRIICNATYSLNIEVEVIKSSAVANFEDCIRTCAQLPEVCTAVDYNRADKTCTFFGAVGGPATSTTTDSAVIFGRDPL